MKHKVLFRLYQIDKSMPDDMIEGYLSLETVDDIDPKIYRIVWESKENPDLDAIYTKYNNDNRPNNCVCRSLSISDIIEIEDGQGSIFYICDNFGWTEIEFDKQQVPHEMGFSNWYINTDDDRKKALYKEVTYKAVVQILVQRLGKSKKVITNMLRNSKAYASLNNEKNGLCDESPYLIVNAFEKELKEKDN